MSRRILIIDGHPDHGQPHFCAALVDAYAAGAASAGHEIRRIVIGSLDVPILRSQADFESGQVPESLRQAAADLLWAEHLVVIFPLWLGTMPALLKAFMEQMIRPGVAFDCATGKALPKSRLKGRSARLIVTMGMPAILFRLWFFSHGVAVLRRNILNFAGVRPVRETFFGLVDRAGEGAGDKWLGKVRRLGEKAL